MDHRHLCPVCMDAQNRGHPGRVDWLCPLIEEHCRGGVWALCPTHAVEAWERGLIS